jgi:hypothetical protein
MAAGAPDAVKPLSETEYYIRSSLPSMEASLNQQVCGCCGGVSVASVPFPPPLFTSPIVEKSYDSALNRAIIRLYALYPGEMNEEIVVKVLAKVRCE